LGKGEKPKERLTLQATPLKTPRIPAPSCGRCCVENGREIQRENLARKGRGSHLQANTKGTAPLHKRTIPVGFMSRSGFGDKIQARCERKEGKLGQGNRKPFRWRECRASHTLKSRGSDSLKTRFALPCNGSETFRREGGEGRKPGKGDQAKRKF